MTDLTSGSVSRHVVRLAAFISFAMLFQSLYFVADLYFVARFGKQAVAGVGLAGSLTFMVLGLTQALSVGTIALMSKSFGRKDRAHAQLIFNQALALSALVGFVFCVVSFTTRKTYARGFAADAEAAELAIQYLTWFVPALSLQFPLVILGAALRAMGDMKMPTVIQAVTVIINIALAPILMFGWGTGRPLGVTGAAIASLLSVAIGCAALAQYYRRQVRTLRFDIRQCMPQPSLWAAILRIGLPAGGELALLMVYTVAVYAVIQPFGAEAQAGFGIGFRVMQTLFLPAFAIAFATAPVAGQNYGAGLGARVRQTFHAAAAMSVAVMVALTVLCQLAPDTLVGWFTADPAAVTIGSEYLCIISWNFLATGLVFVSSSMFQALGNTLPPLASSTLRMVSFAVLAYAISGMSGFALHHVWYLSVATVTIQVVLNLWLLRRELARKL